MFLTNFTAKILADIVEDDGVEQRRSFAMEAVLSDRVWRFTVPAAQFPSLQWATEHLGATAIVSAGMGMRDHARVAIQALSGDIQECHVFTHTGWRELPSGWAYLHAGGAIDGHGPLADVEVALPEALAHYMLADPPSGAALVHAIQASLRMLQLAPDRVTVPVYAAVWRAALGGADFALHLAGRSGVGKTEVAALAQQHFGAPMDARHLPGGWSSTGNALEALAFQAKDAILVIDDFAPTGSSADVQRLHRDADRLLRAQGNRAGRQRMRADTTLRAPKPPRGLIVSTGEDIPRGQSLRARVLIVELGTGDVQWAQLGRCQQEAAAGLYAQALAGFVRWLAPRYARLQRALQPALARLRQQATGEEGHRRTPEIIANLALGWRLFLIYGRAAGALTRQEAQALWQKGWRALHDAARDQEPHQRASEPATRFLELLSAAIASGQAHVAADNGLPPPAPEAWGWRRMTVGSGVFARDDWEPQGSRVGWLSGTELYLEPDAAYAAVQGLGQKIGDALSVTPQTLRKRLRDQGLLASIDRKRETLTIRKTLEGRQQPVLHLLASTLLLRHDPDNSDRAAGVPQGQPTDARPLSGTSAGGDGRPPTYPTSKTLEESINSTMSVGSVGSRGEQRSLEGLFDDVGTTDLSDVSQKPDSVPDHDPTSASADGALEEFEL